MDSLYFLLRSVPKNIVMNKQGLKPKKGLSTPCLMKSQDLKPYKNLTSCEGIVDFSGFLQCILEKLISLTDAMGLEG
jgi:hypothetical protein